MKEKSAATENLATEAMVLDDPESRYLKFYLVYNGDLYIKGMTDPEHCCLFSKTTIDNQEEIASFYSKALFAPFAVIMIAVCAVMYYRFGVQACGTALKIMVAAVVLFAILACGATGVIIHKAVRARKKREKDDQDRHIKAMIDKLDAESVGPGKAGR